MNGEENELFGVDYMKGMVSLENEVPKEGINEWMQAMKMKDDPLIPLRMIAMAKVSEEWNVLIMVLEGLEERWQLEGKENEKIIMTFLSYCTLVFELFFSRQRGEQEEELVIKRGWECIISFVTFLHQKVFSEEAISEGRLLRLARMQHSLIMMASACASSNEEDIGGEVDVPVDTLSKSVFTIEGVNKLVGCLLGSLWDQRVALSCRLGIVNLLGRIARLRPTTLLPKTIPTLLSLLEEGNVDGEEVLRFGGKFVENTLIRQLSVLLAVPSAEKFHPLIMEALQRRDLSFMKQQQKLKGNKKKRSTLAEDADEDENEDEDLALVGTKKIKSTSEEGIGASVSIPPVTSFSFPQVAEILIATLRIIKIDQLKNALTVWRPPVSSSAASIRDPRRAPPPSIQSQPPSNLLEKEDQMVPFDLMPKYLSKVEEISFMKERFQSILEGLYSVSLMKDPKKRKSRLYSIIRIMLFIESIDTSHTSAASLRGTLSSMLINFCCAEPVERMSVLLYWMRLIWLQGESQSNTENSSSNVYSETFTNVINHLKQMVIDGRDWDLAAHKFLSEAVFIPEGEHIPLFEDVFSDHNNVSLISRGLVLIESLLGSRPTIIESLITFLVNTLFDGEQVNPSLKKAILARLFIPDNKLLNNVTFKTLLKECSDRKYSIANSDSLNEFDLPCHMAMISKDSMAKCCEYLITHSEDEIVCNYIFTQITLLLSIISTESSVYLSQLNYSEGAAIIDKLFIPMIKSKSLGKEAIDEALVSIASRKWPCHLLEQLITVVTPAQRDLLKTALAVFIQDTDPTEDQHRSIYANIIAKSAEVIGPTNLFVFLHSLEGVLPLKRCIDVIQLCFILTIVFKTDTISSALKELIDQPTLPLTLFRTLIQSVTTHRTLTHSVIGLLTRLITERSIWENAKQWDGFGRCVKALLPSSHAVLIQLPVERLKELLEMIPEVKTTFLPYLRQQSATVQQRYQL